MRDLLYVAATAGFFGLMILYVRAFDRLGAAASGKDHGAR